MTDAFRANIGRPKGTTEPLSVRLFRNSMPVTESGCWFWLGELCELGYGLMRVNKLVKRAHRVSWQEFKSPIPPDMNVLHRCDIRCCINPDHLFLGTQAENMDDMVKKGRCRRSHGSTNGNSKLTEAQAIEIRAASGSHSEVACRYGIGKSIVSYIRRGESWRHL
jgi:hypothetical protein